MPNSRRPTNGDASPAAVAKRITSNGSRQVLDDQSFHKMIALERKRSERSHKSFLLMLLDAGDQLPSQPNGEALGKILAALSLATRETDVTGWYQNNATVGVMFTEIASEDRHSIVGTLLTRISVALKSSLSLDLFNQVSISFHLFPEEFNRDMPQCPSDPTLYPDILRRDKTRKLFSIMKRLMDIAGSAAALALFSPILVLIAVLIKLSSRGPVILRQKRLGQFGKTFTLLKFRTMYANSDSQIHREFMQRVITGNYDGTVESGKPVYTKMTDDPRVTRIGRLLRRTSMDELPQFFNVLKGDMSLVGPRPPLAYEYVNYDIWHRRRVVEGKPGITGLWQVSGRSRLPFDEMVRLDIQYERASSFWLDLQILMQTPRAILLGDDAF
jgi:lipopolysaccharide/colanic/teichoic acid biosynthesis glycosyltransferase